MANQVFFNLQPSSVSVNKWVARKNSSWHTFLQTNGVWANQKGGEVNGTWSFYAPVKAYYMINGSCDNQGTVWVDEKKVLDIQGFKDVWNASVLLEAGNHSIRVWGRDTGGDYAIAVTVEADVQTQIDAQNAANQANATAASAKADYDAKQAQAVSAQAAVKAEITTDTRITLVSKNASVSGNASTSAGATAGAEAHAGVEGQYASAGASASASAGVSASASAEAQAGNQYAGVGAGASATGYANASAEASAQAGAGLQGNNAVAGGSVEIVIRTEAGVSAEAQANATLLGIQLAEAQAQGGASTYTEVYVRADGSVSIGENGASVQAGAIAGYGIGAGVQGSAGVDTVLGDADVEGGAEVSIGAQIGAEGEAHATYENGKISIGISGEAAILIGLDADMALDLDIGPTIDAVNAVLKSGGTLNQAITKASTGINQTAVAYNKTQKQLQALADQAWQAAKQAEKVYNNAASAANQAANQALNVTNDAINQTEKAFVSAGKTVTNGVVNLGKNVSNGAKDLGNDISNGASSAWSATKKFFSDSRLKQNIQRADQVCGINVYTYNYVWATAPQRGVIAQELLETEYSHAVSLHSSGYYAVDYSQLPDGIWRH